MAYTKKDFSSLIGTPGFSDELLNNHFTLYEGYVNNTNKLVEILDTKEFSTPEYAEIQRRFGWEWNGMRLHELYFENLQKEKTSEPEGLLKEKLEKIYGSIEKWQQGFENLGTMRGIGWVVLCWDEEQDELFSIWVNEHDVGILAGTKILLVMDVFEHAFMIDYGLKRIDYIKNFFAHINWGVVTERLRLQR
jgi:Fe-Mn family superoxide dismutase